MVGERLANGWRMVGQLLANPRETNPSVLHVTDAFWIHFLLKKYHIFGKSQDKLCQPNPSLMMKIVASFANKWSEVHNHQHYNLLTLSLYLSNKQCPCPQLRSPSAYGTSWYESQCGLSHKNLRECGRRLSHCHQIHHHRP